MARSVIEEYFAAQDPYDAERLAALRHPEWSAEWPQSGERIPSHEADRQIHENYPGYPAHDLGRVAHREEQWALSPVVTPVRLTESGHLFTAEVTLEYPGDDRWFSAGVGELRDGLIYREVVYFCPPFEAAAYRSGWVEPIPPGKDEPIEVGYGTGDEERRRRLIWSYLDLTKDRRWVEAIPLLWAEDAIDDIPQSGERIRGVPNLINVTSKHPDTPRTQGRRVHGEGNLFAIEAEVDYGGTPWLQLLIVVFRGGKVAAGVGYFAEPVDPPEWRARWVERM